MANVVIIGMQWGDEGKGKIVDLICPAFDTVARFQGGHNAGHTVKFGDQHFSLHLIPSGILHADTRCVLGSGMVIAPDAFFSELEKLRAGGIEDAGRLFLSNRATALLPCHARLDQARERARGERAIGTTSRGIGPAYESRAGRYGLRLIDLLAPDLEDLLGLLLDRVDGQLADLGDTAKSDASALLDQCRSWGERLAPRLADTEQLLGDWLAAGSSVLFEGAQGTLLDLAHGTYPFVTSSSCTTGAAATGAGVAPTALNGAIGVLKAYTTRVGAGPFVTELHDDSGEFLRSRGNEFGTTTGRPRRCGWLDLVAGRYSRMLNGIESIALTKLDVLDDLDEIKVCTAYRIDGEQRRGFPSGQRDLERAEPVYRSFPGWRQRTVGILCREDLPAAAQEYIAFIEEDLNARVDLISTGPRREETIVDQQGRLAGWFGEGLAAVLAQRTVGE
ncbi:MAG: adenylosuccinate synthase [Acidobacteriota bacterium]